MYSAGVRLYSSGAPYASYASYASYAIYAPYAIYAIFLLPLHLKRVAMITIEQIKDLVERRDALRRYL